MLPPLPSIVPATHLSISVSGTAYLQKTLGEKTPTAPQPSDLPSSRSGASELARASKSVQDVIEAALRLADPNASIKGYKDGESFSNGLGLAIDIIA